MTYEKMVRGLVAAALLTFLSTEARATLIIGDLVSGGQIFSGYNVGTGGGLDNAIAEGFTMTQTTSLASVSVYLSNYVPSAGSNIALSIYSNSGGTPGTDLYDLSTSVTAGTGSVATLETFAGTGSFTLSASTKYWLDMYATNPSSPTETSVQWDGAYDSGFHQVNPSGPGATDVGQSRSVGAGNPPTGTPSTTELRTAFQLNGASVPEPATLTLLSTALLALAAVNLRRRRPKP